MAKKNLNGERRGVEVNGVFYEGLKEDAMGVYAYDPSLPRGRNVIRFGKPDTPEKVRKIEARILRWQYEQAQRRGDAFADATMGITVRRADVKAADDDHRQILDLLKVRDITEDRKVAVHRSDPDRPGAVRPFFVEPTDELDLRLYVGGKVPVSEFWKQLGAAIRRNPKVWARRLGLEELRDLLSVQPQPDRSLSTLLDKWLNRVPPLSNVEKAACRRIWKRFTNAVAVGTIGDVDEEAVQRFAETVVQLIDEREWTNWEKTVGKNIGRVKSILRHSADSASPTDHCARVIGLLKKHLDRKRLESHCTRLGEERKSKRYPKPEEFHALLKAADTRLMRCYLLLAANCGFTNMSIMGLWRESLHLTDKVPFHDFHRVKNREATRMACLWPETVQALQDYLVHEHNPHSTDGNRTRFFNHDGQPLINQQRDRDWLNRRTEDLIRRAGIDPQFNMSFFRYGVENIPRDLASDRDTAVDTYHIDLVMGHTLPKTQRHYILAGPAPLKYIADFLHAYYFQKPKKRRRSE